jgi:hypothetical protein
LKHSDSDLDAVDWHTSGIEDDPDDGARRRGRRTWRPGDGAPAGRLLGVRGTAHRGRQHRDDCDGRAEVRAHRSHQ